MFSAEIIIIFMLISLLSVLMTGFPVAFTLSGVALIFGLFGSFFGVFDLAFVQALPNRIYGIMTVAVAELRKKQRPGMIVIDYIVQI